MRGGLSSSNEKPQLEVRFFENFPGANVIKLFVRDLQIFAQS